MRVKPILVTAAVALVVVMAYDRYAGGRG